MSSQNLRHITQNLLTFGLDHLSTSIQAFLTDKQASGLSPHTISFYRDCLIMFEKFCANLAVTKIEQVDANLIRQYLLHLEQTGHNSTSRHGHYRALRAFMYWLEVELGEDEYRAPIRKVKPPKLPKDLIEGANLEDVQRMVAACAGHTFTALRDKALLLFLLDTGASATLMTPGFRDRVGARVAGREVTFSGAGNLSGSRQVVRVGRARLAGMEWRDFDCVVDAMQALQPVHDRPLDGIVGINLLGARPCSIDIPGRSIVLGAPVPAAGGAPSCPVGLTPSGVPTVVLRVNGRAVTFVLDTGANRTFMRRGDWNGAVDAAAGAVTTGIDGRRDETVRSAQRADVRLGGVLVRGVELTLRDGGTNLLGMDFFRANGVWLDLGRRVVVVRPSGP